MVLSTVHLEVQYEGKEASRSPKLAATGSSPKSPSTHKKPVAECLKQPCQREEASLVSASQFLRKWWSHFICSSSGSGTWESQRTTCGSWFSFHLSGTSGLLLSFTNEGILPAPIHHFICMLLIAYKSTSTYYHTTKGCRYVTLVSVSVTPGELFRVSSLAA